MSITITTTYTCDRCGFRDSYDSESSHLLDGWETIPPTQTAYTLQERHICYRCSHNHILERVQQPKASCCNCAKINAEYMLHLKTAGYRVPVCTNCILAIRDKLQEEEN